MTASSHWRGHPIYWDGERWRYCDNHQPTVGNERNCGECGKARTPQGQDGCLGTLPGVTNACCGHGHQAEAYVQFTNGGEMRGMDAVQFFNNQKLSVPIISGKRWERIMKKRPKWTWTEIREGESND